MLYVYVTQGDPEPIHPEDTVRFFELPDSPDQQRQQLIQNGQIKSGTFNVLELDVAWTS